MRRTKAKAAETRAAVLDAAEMVFHRQGVAGTSLSDIASAAKVTRGAIYWHFANKAVLFQAMAERASAPEEEFFLARAADGRRDGERLAYLRALMMEMVARFVADERAQRVHEIVLFRCEYVGEMDEAQNRRREKEQAFEEAVLGIFDEASRHGEMGRGWTPALAAAALRCVVLGSIADWLRLERNFDLVELSTALLDGLFASLAVERPAPVLTGRRAEPSSAP